MNQEETLRLWQNCEAARSASEALGYDEEDSHLEASIVWEASCTKLLADLEELDTLGIFADQYAETRSMTIVRACFDCTDDASRERIEKITADIEPWKEAALADFSGHNFKQKVSFDGFCFPGSAYFTDCVFDEAVSFSECLFLGSACFRGATFVNGAYFSGVRFHDNAAFEGVKFLADTEFGVGTLF